MPEMEMEDISSSTRRSKSTSPFAHPQDNPGTPAHEGGTLNPAFNSSLDENVGNLSPAFSPASEKSDDDISPAFTPSLKDGISNPASTADDNETTSPAFPPTQEHGTPNPAFFPAHEDNDTPISAFFPSHEDNDTPNPAFFPAHEDNDTPNPAFTPAFDDEPVPLPSRSRPSSREFTNIANHLIFDTHGSRRAANTTFDGFLSDRRPQHLPPSAQKYATTRLSNGPNRKTHNSFRESLPNGDLGMSKSLGRHSGQIYVRGGQRRSSRKYFVRGISHDGPISGGNIYRLSNTERKDSAFTFFDIETDKVGSYQYRPGEQITGSIKIIVRKPVEIRYVELMAVGQGRMLLRRSGEGQVKTSQETYLNKQTYVIGSGDSQWSTVLTAGHYTSKFRVKLPSSLPSSTQHNDARHGLSIHIDYTLRARICDNAPYSTAQHGLARVLLAKKIPFCIQRAFDLSQLPEATAPVFRNEQVHLSCTHPDPAHVSLNLDRAVCLAGDDIRVTLTAQLPTSHNVKDVTCELQEIVALDPKHHSSTFTLSKVIRKDPTGRIQKAPPANHYLRHHSKHQVSRASKGHNSGGVTEETTYEVTLSTHTGLISPYSLGGSNISLKYALFVQLRIAPAGGKLTFQVPLEIGPCAEPIYAEKISSRKAVPLFNRPTRFSCFSFQAPSTPSAASSRPPSAQSSRSALVKAKYTNSCWARCFLCCMGPPTSE